MENGVVVLRSFYDDGEMNMIKRAINSAVDKPSPFKSFTENPMDLSIWILLIGVELKNLKRHVNIKKVDTLKELVGSKKCWLFHDHILIKSGEAPPTHGTMIDLIIFLKETLIFLFGHL